MVTTENSICPVCDAKGAYSRVVALFYKCQEALYTCENKMCPYFVTNTEGNPIKFNKETNKSSYVLEATEQQCKSEDDFTEFLNSLTEPTTDYMYRSSKTGKHSQSSPSKSSHYGVKTGNANELSNYKSNEIFDISLLDNIL